MLIWYVSGDEPDKHENVLSAKMTSQMATSFHSQAVVQRSC